MRRPGLTARQKQHAREQRALVRLRRAAVHVTNLVDAGDDAGEALYALEGAAFAYTNALSKRDRRRFS